MRTGTVLFAANCSPSCASRNGRILSEGRVVVSDGIVHLWGIVGSDEERRALRVAADNTPGVRGVEDHTEFAPALPAM